MIYQATRTRRLIVCWLIGEQLHDGGRMRLAILWPLKKKEFGPVSFSTDPWSSDPTVSRQRHHSLEKTLACVPPDHAASLVGARLDAFHRLFLPDIRLYVPARGIPHQMFSGPRRSFRSSAATNPAQFL